MMTLQSLVPEVGPDVSIPVSGLTDDSRQVKAGDLFIAVTGAHYSANQMLSDIESTHVAAVLCDESELVESRLPLFKVKALGQQKGEIASRFYGNPSAQLHVVAITGTNGKTSCSQFVANAMNVQCGVVGTMGSGLGTELVNPGLTTPDALTVQKILAEFVMSGAEAVCLEASSHGLSQGRLNGTSINTAVFTNITRDHLDYHKTFDAYKAAKRILFEWPGLECAVLNADDEFSQELKEVISADVQCYRYSLSNSDAEIFCTSAEFGLKGISASVHTPWGDIQVSSSLMGDFNLSNLLAVIAVLGSFGLDAAEISDNVSRISHVVGRMDQVALKKGAVAIIDYAHTPNALENALQAARVHCEGSLICVMGCGGDRDVGKRPLMGEIATRLADVTIITDDNPRTEASDQIITDILAGAKDQAAVRVEPNRRCAIETALSEASKGDVVLIAGKGHETYQEVNGIKHNFSDHEEVALYESTYREHRGA